MSEDELNVHEVKVYWSSEASEALQVANHLVEKEDYSYALFFGHLAIEKLLKAYYVAKKEQHAPPTHNLLRIARAAGLEPDDEKVDALVTITAFNIEARYPDVKRVFRRKCTAEFTKHQMQLVKEVFE